FGSGNTCPSSWTSVFGAGKGCPDVSPTAFLVDVCNNIYLSGWGGPVLSGFGGTSGLPISASAFQTTTDNNDYYFLVISEDASTMKYATYFGSPHAYEHVDGGTSRFDRKGLIYQGVCGGCGGYSDFPTTAGAWSNTNNSTNCNNAVIKFDFGLPIVVADFNIPPVGCAPYIVNFQNTSHSTGGSGVNYSWTFGDGGTSTLTNPSHTYTGAGVYNVTLIISDTGSCNSSDTISKQFVILSNSTDTLPPKYICSGSNVQIGLLPQPDTSLTYHWTPPLNLSNDTISNPIANPLISTNYVLVISNGLCTDTILQSVGVGNLTVNAGPDTTICPGSSVILSATSIGGATSYIWSTTSDFHDTLNYPLTNNSASVTPAVPSTYYIQVSNQYCTKIDSVHVNFVILRISPSLLIEPSCAGSCDGQIIVSTSGGTSPYSYIWSTGNTGDTLVNICSGNYYVTVSDSKGCKKMDTLTLNSPDTLKINVTHLNVICYDSCHGAAEASAYGGTPSYTYQWNNGDTGNTAIYLCPGIYYVTATDNHLCKAVDTVVISSSAAIPPSIYTYADNTTIYVPQSTGLHTTVVPGYTYSWSPPTGLNNPDIANPVANPTTTTTYIVTVKDQYGCTLMDTITIYVLEVSCNESDIFVPNAFTPNGDNKNDILYVRSNILKSIYFVIYDRWGEKVFETYDQSTGWNGTFKGKACDPGVFDYYMKATCINDKEFIKKGNITLIR
ncbi:MAG: PKD domain-containing protein, partial [Bacteroidales bacterium]